VVQRARPSNLLGALSLPRSGRPPVPCCGVSTRRLIIAALLCGLAILVAFSVQLLLVL
jgi:hypothetical protein